MIFLRFVVLLMFCQLPLGSEVHAADVTGVCFTLDVNLHVHFHAGHEVELGSTAPTGVLEAFARCDDVGEESGGKLGITS